MRSPYIEHEHLVRFVQAQDQQGYQTQSEIVTELLTRSMFIKM